MFKAPTGPLPAPYRIPAGSIPAPSHTLTQTVLDMHSVHTKSQIVFLWIAYSQDWRKLKIEKPSKWFLHMVAEGKPKPLETKAKSDRRVMSSHGKDYKKNTKE